MGLDRSDQLRMPSSRLMDICKQVLLVDDVLTTGATLEACALKLQEIEGLKVYLATIACGRI